MISHHKGGLEGNRLQLKVSEVSNISSNVLFSNNVRKNKTTL